MTDESSITVNLLRFYRRSKYLFFIFITIGLTWLIFTDLVDGDWGSLENSLENLSVFFHESLWPPEWKVL